MEDQLLYHIIERCKKGDRKAQTELYRRYYRGMYNVSLRILKHTAEAEDAMQEAFIAAFGQLETFRGDVPFGGWLKRIVINRSIDQLRKRKDINTDLSQLANLPDDQPSKQHDETKLSGISPEMVKEAINNLQDNYRIVLSLFLLEGYDHDEIAEIMKISNVSSRVIYHRAKEKLKVILSKMKAELNEVNYG
jgi:RNA polymerase sigma-70 factor (ECF subfamily)